MTPMRIGSARSSAGPDGRGDASGGSDEPGRGVGWTAALQSGGSGPGGAGRGP